MKKIFLLLILNIFVLSIADAQWQQTSCPYISNHFFYSLVSDSSKIFAGTDQPGNIFLSYDNGVSWSIVSNGLSGSSVTSIAIKDSNIFATDWGGGVFLSTNNGISWASVNSGLSNTMTYSLLISDSNIFVGYNGGVCLSTNNGANWIPINNGLPNTLVRSLAKSGTNIFAGTAGNGVYMTSNNGVNWTAVNNGLADSNVYSLSALGTKVFAGTQGGCFLTSNNGLNWTSVINLSVISFAVSGSNIFAGIESGYVYLSVDSGANWVSVSNGLNGASIYSLSVSDSNIFAGTWGWGVWKSSLSTLLGINETDNNKVFIYPNPVSDIIRIENLMEGKNSTISIYDLQARCLLMSKMKKVNVELNLCSLLQGVYFLEVIMDDERIIKKIVKE